MTSNSARADLIAAVDNVITMAGGAAVLARAMRLSRGAPHHWRRSGKIPAERVGELSRLTGLAPHQIRPDLFSMPSELFGQDRGISA